MISPIGLTGAESRVRVRAQQLAAVWDDAGGLTGALQALEADLSLAPDASEDVLALARRASEMRVNIGFLMRADDPTYVYFLEVRGRGTFLRAAPIDVSDIVRELLLDRMKATPRDILRTRNTQADDLGLTDPNASDAAILDAMVADPVLVERPIVETEKGAVLARPIEKIDEVL